MAEPAGCQPIRLHRDGVRLADAEHRVAERQASGGGDPAVVLCARDVETQVGAQRGRLVVGHRQRSGFAGAADRTTVVLDHTVEEHADEPAVHQAGRALIDQREMFLDTKSWSNALKAALREDPNVVLVGEMRDLETISSAMTIAETGHLVFATLHTNSAAQSVDRIIDVFPEVQQPQIRLQLASTLESIISLRLIPTVQPGRALATEVLFATPAIKNIIREGKTYLIDNVIETSAELGMQVLESSLADLVKKGKISEDMALRFAIRPELLEKLLK